MNYEGWIKQFERLFSHQMSDKEMRLFLIDLDLDIDIDEKNIAAAAFVMRKYSIPLHVDKEFDNKLIDIVGTGGDKIGSFNISSTVALLVASGGAYVVKHGNRSITSKSGSADMLQNLGIRLDLSPTNSKILLQESGFAFIFAQEFHPAMKFIMPIRKSIPNKTIFNILGPLTNPANVKKIFLGVFDKSLIDKLVNVLKFEQMQSAMVVSSQENMDEISISNITYAARLESGSIKNFIIDPEILGIKKAPLKAILGGDAKQNCKITLNIFNNRATDAQRDIVLLNAAAAFIVDGKARDFQDGIEIARELLLSGKAKEKLKQIIEISSKL